ncbi:MAG: alpha/beta hydrolase [Myxococcota bacterium]|nr:alpha/beta hydrolase [Myxococcota bacterium]
MRVALPIFLERAGARACLAMPPGVLRRIVGPAWRSPEGLELDLQVQVLLELLRLTEQPDVWEGSLESARRYMDRASNTLAAKEVDVAMHDLTIPGPSGPLPARVYRAATRRRTDLSPGLVWFHGGGWVLGSTTSAHRVCRSLAKRAGVVVVSVDYRLAPEHPFPAATLDAIAATRWILEAAPTLGVDAGAVGVGGDSAGGNLAALVAQSARGERRRPAFQLLVYPATDLTRSHESHRLFADGYLLTKRAMDWYLGHYLPDGASASDPAASPFFATDLSGLPPALVLTAGFDPLRDEGVAYAEKMRAAGGEVEHVCAAGLIHGFLAMTGSMGQAERMLDLAARRLRTALARSGVEV